MNVLEPIPPLRLLLGSIPAWGRRQTVGSGTPEAADAWARHDDRRPLTVARAIAREEAISMSARCIVQQYRLNLAYAMKLVEDVAEEQMSVTPGPGLENHPAFVLGHLITGSAMVADDLGGPSELPAGWAELFSRRGPADTRKPDPDRSLFPSKEALVAELARRHGLVENLLLAADASKLGASIEWRLDAFLPTLLDNVTFMCVSHEMLHLGQLAAWRRAMGLPPALAGL